MRVYVYLILYLLMLGAAWWAAKHMKRRRKIRKQTQIVLERMNNLGLLRKSTLQLVTLRR